MVLLFSFSCFSTYRTLRIVVEPLDKNAPHLAISRLRDANSYKSVKVVHNEIEKDKAVALILFS